MTDLLEGRVRQLEHINNADKGPALVHHREVKVVSVCDRASGTA